MALTPEDAEIVGPEALHPDLHDYVLDSPRFGHGIYHPLIHYPLFGFSRYEVDMVNRAYPVKKAEVEQARANHDWSKAMLYYERPYRLRELRRWFDEGVLTVDQLREVLPSTWSDAEPLDEMAWFDLFVTVEYCGTPLTEVPARYKLANGNLRVYRGQPRGSYSSEGELGPAWSLSRDIARFFATRYDEKGEVIVGEVVPAYVRAYITDRNEQEIIVHPAAVYVQRVYDTRRRQSAHAKQIVPIYKQLHQGEP